MRRTIALLLLLGIPALVSAESAFNAKIGGNFYRYERGYLSTGLTYLLTLEEGMELNVGGDFGISTRREDGEIKPSFLVPANVGLNFTFPQEVTNFYVGFGLTPVFAFNTESDDDFSFLMGPYGRAGMRLRVHRIMSWFVEYQQDLLIGGEQWINTSTRLNTGIHFSFDPDTYTRDR
ncbi:MAG: hypothetical protein ACLFUM_04700 [Spirochaetaceae bacterium]